MIKAQIVKITSLYLTLSFLAVISPYEAIGQDALQLTSEAIRHQKKIYIEKVMELTPQEKDAFWRLYEEFDSGLTKISGKRIELATKFLATNGNLTDAEALDMLDEELQIDADELKFKQAYVAKFSQVLPGRKVVRFYQTANRFDTAATSELYKNIPVIR